MLRAPIGGMIRLAQIEVQPGGRLQAIQSAPEFAGCAMLPVRQRSAAATLDRDKLAMRQTA